VHLALFVTPQVLLFADTATRAWLGPAFAGAGAIIRLTVFPVAFYMCSVMLRSSLDAAAVRAYNSRNRLYGVAVSVALGALLLTLHIGEPIRAIAIAFSAGLITVGATTFMTARRLYDIPSSAWTSGVALLLAAVAAGIGAAFRFLVIGSHTTLLGLAVLVVLELALLAAFVVGLARSGIAWPEEMRARLGRAQPKS
jgi:hypothetical protein